jgi:DNA repair protein RecN (Recombination protein N)
MLVQLAIRDIVLIEKLDLEFGQGLTVLTGETGAGKSILLDAFALTLGARGDGALVRHGAAQGQVTAVFELPSDHPALAAAAAQGIDIDGGLILRRTQMEDGRTRAFVNDQPVSLQALRGIARELVEIHGQHDDRALVQVEAHRQLLDAFAGLAAEQEAVRAAYRARRGAETELVGEERRIEQARREADYLTHAHAELTKLAVRPGEEEILAHRRQRLMQNEKVGGELRDAVEAISGERSPVAALSSALRRLERRQTQAPELLAPVVAGLDTALVAFDAARAALEDALCAAGDDPGELERVEERLFALRAASRKHSVAVEALPALCEKIADDLAKLEAGETRLKQLRAAAAAAVADYDKAAKRLSAARQRAALDLAQAVNAELPPLKLEAAEFSVKHQADAATVGPDGIDHIEFWVKTNPGTRPGPLMKVASGGELARFMLALKVVLADRGSAPTLVFDEIDTGAGGAVADAIGQRLAQLAHGVQVLAVTHAPQVAAQAEGHFRIVKDLSAADARVATRVVSLTKAARREEIARMLAGATITAEARAAAGRLMNNRG